MMIMIIIIVNGDDNNSNTNSGDGQQIIGSWSPALHCIGTVNSIKG